MDIPIMDLRSIMVRLVSGDRRIIGALNIVSSSVRAIIIIDIGKAQLRPPGRGKGRQVNPISGEHDRVAAAYGPAIDNRGVNADVDCVVLGSRAEDS